MRRAAIDAACIGGGYWRFHEPQFETKDWIWYNPDNKAEFEEAEMKAGRLLGKNFNARIPKIEIKLKGSDSK